MANARLVPHSAHDVGLLSLAIDSVAHGLAVNGDALVLRGKGGIPFLQRTIEHRRIHAYEHSADNIRDEANAAQLVCLANLETLNAHFIHQRLAQTQRLALLNQTAIVQMKLLLADVGVQRLQGKQP